MNNNDTGIENFIEPRRDDMTIYQSLGSLPSEILQWLDKNSMSHVMVWDTGGKLRYITDSMENVLGYKAEELIGKTWREIVSPMDIKYIEQAFYDEGNDGLESEDSSFDVSMVNKNGQVIWFEYRLGKVHSKKDESFFITTIQELKDQQEAKNRLIQSEKLSVAGQLAAGIAHEIRNPLTSLKGFLQLLQAGVSQKEVYYKIMYEEIEKIEAITTELLFLSKPMTNNKKEESVQSMINDVIILLRLQAKLNNIVIETQIDEDYSIFCDRSQMKQVFINLIKNAIEVSEADTKVVVISRKKEDCIEIDVVDEGPGIPESIIHKIGEPFFTTRNGGTGLGIMITKQILKHHESKLEILSNESKGTIFRICFPI
ncbi:ATP-binding protein [Ornithinibacillus sp. 4-3]|uniref:histidine kinase n=1 Tax=Ornithinibacillus sp. 4-3 TaxID=3231488 RepID=A0AB39HU42_9BACI